MAEKDLGNHRLCQIAPVWGFAKNWRWNRHRQRPTHAGRSYQL